MTENEYIQLLRSKHLCERERSAEAIVLADEAVEAYPESAELWHTRGYILSMGVDDIPYEISEILHSYEKAVSLDPDFAEAFEDIGYYYYNIAENYVEAEKAFRKSISIENRIDSFVGLAYVMARNDYNRDEILALLDTAPLGSDRKRIEAVKADICKLNIPIVFKYDNHIKDDYVEISDSFRLKLFPYVIAPLIGIAVIAVGSLGEKYNSRMISFPVMFGLFILFGIAGWYWRSRKRICPKCQNEMIYFEPDALDRKTTYKFICHACKLFIDTKEDNDRGGD